MLLLVIPVILDSAHSAADHEVGLPSDNSLLNSDKLTTLNENNGILVPAFQRPVQRSTFLNILNFAVSTLTKMPAQCSHIQF